MKHIFRLFFLLLILPSLVLAGESKLYQFLKTIPDAEITSVDSSAWEEFYIVMFPQPLDHGQPKGESFKQRIFVGHRGFEQPVVMETEGYGADWMNGFLIDEPATLLNANQIYVEHRYFGASVPKKMDWKYLTSEQDAGDYHAIRTTFGKIYPGKWITTGVSKGGQTAVAYKVFYPNDVDLTIPYVAPINYKRLDGRINRHFKTVGSEECRKHITALQEYYLKNKKELLPLYEKMCIKFGYTFKIMDVESAFDYSVLEFPFSFWQYTADCKVLPDPAKEDVDTMVRFLIRIVNPYWYTESTEQFAPANYQFYTQLGYYEYNEWPFRRYLKHKDYPNSAFVPKGSEVKWDGSYIRKLKNFMQSDPDRMIFIYGEADPWGATAAKIEEGNRSIKMVLEGGTHGTTIGSLDKAQQEKVYAKMKEWLGVEIQIPSNNQ